jgi:uncharacterized membrane protein
MPAAPLDLGFEDRSIRHASIDEPGVWLLLGWRDFQRAPVLSLTYGGVFVLLGYGIVLGLHGLGLTSLVPVAIAGFWLIAPLLAVGLHEVSRRLEAREAIHVGDVLRVFHRNPRGIFAMGLILVLAFGAWAQVALLIFMAFFHANPPPLDDFIFNLLTSPQLVPFLAVGGAAGFAIASVVFAISAVSIPMLLDRDVTAGEAIATSVVAVRENYRVMLAWAATIVLLVGLGFATMFIGLAFTLPWLAYATWHSYRSLVPRDG